jgi:hypothetical protein
VLSTKVGYGIPGLADWTGPCIATGGDAALARLATDRLDVVHLHSCPREVLERGEVVEALLAAAEVTRPAGAPWRRCRACETIADSRGAGAARDRETGGAPARATSERELRGVVMRGAGVVGLSVMVAVSLCVSGVPASAQDAAGGSGWTFALEPYIWAAGVDGTVKYEIPPDNEGAADVGLAIEDLTFAFMLTGEARKGDWAIMADMVYLDMQNDGSEVKSVRFAGPGGEVEVAVDADVGTSTTLTGLEWQLAGSYTLARGSSSSLEALAGVRYLTLEAGTAWQISGDVVGPGPGQSFDRSGDVSQRVELWNGIVGVRGALGLGGRWSLPFYADVGAGGSTATWQAVAGVKYAFGWGDLHFAYRYLLYDMKADKLLQDVAFSGAGVGVRFTF